MQLHLTELNVTISKCLENLYGYLPLDSLPSLNGAGAKNQMSSKKKEAAEV